MRAQDLRFTTEEAAAFLNEMMGLDLTPADAAALEERTEGWIAGLQLAALSMKGRSDTAGFVRAFTGSHVYIAEYLLEEVLQRQPEAVQSFLLKTSILDRLTAGLCEAVTGCEDGQSILLALQHANLFVVPLDDEARWFRYHHLFADLLRARLSQARTFENTARLHQRAAAWFEQSGMAAEAVDHALAGGDFPLALSLVEKLALPMFLQARVRTIEVWLQAIPVEFIDASPRANMAMAWMNLLRAAAPAAEPYLQRLETNFSNMDEGSLEPALLGEWLALQSEWLNRQGKPLESRIAAARALEILPEAAAEVRSMAHVNLAAAYEQTLEYDQAAAAYGMIVHDARVIGNSILETLGISGHARMLLEQGRLHQAFETASEGIQRLASSGRITPFSATLFGEMGQINYHWHRLEQAEEYSRQSAQLSGQSGYSDPEMYTHVVRSRIFQMEGDWPAAAREMEKAAELGNKIPPAMVREEVISQQVRVDLALNRLAAAEAVLKPEGFSFNGELQYPALEPGTPVPHPAGLLYNSALRVLLSLSKANQDLIAFRLRNAFGRKRACRRAALPAHPCLGGNPAPAQPDACCPGEPAGQSRGCSASAGTGRTGGLRQHLCGGRRLRSPRPGRPAGRRLAGSGSSRLCPADSERIPGRNAPAGANWQRYGSIRRGRGPGGSADWTGNGSPAAHRCRRLRTGILLKSCSSRSVR